MCGAKIVQSFGVAKFCSVKLPVVAVWGLLTPWEGTFLWDFEEKIIFFAFFFRKRLVVQKKAVPLHSQNGNKPIAPWNTEQKFAEIAQLVEHNLAKVRVASSSLVFRSQVWICVYNRGVGVMPRWRNGRRARFRCECWETCRFESCSGHRPNEFWLTGQKMERWRNW